MTWKVSIVVSLLLLCSFALFGQAISGTIYGYVFDETGAVVPNASVSVLNTDTNYLRKTQTGGDGSYSFASLPIGRYRLTVEAQGFNQLVQEGITLRVDQQARINASLKVGSVTEQVLVTSEAPLLNTTNAETSEVIDRRRVEELPLNGRNFTQLIQLTTGTTPGTVFDNQDVRVINLFRAPTFFTANGMRNMTNNYVLDGVDNNENAFNSGGIVIRPVVDAIEEFKVSTGNFSSEFGRAAGGVVNVQTRSGTNEFHGNLFEFLRNDSLDANEFFNNANNRPIPQFQRNQFGGTIGGPIIKDSLFFFGDYQGMRQRRGLTLLGSVAPLEAREGDFSNPAYATIYDPLTGKADPQGTGIIREPFSNQRIPQSRFDPVSPEYFDLIPVPNTNPGGIVLNFINNPKWIRDDNQGDVRIDKSLGTKGTLTGRYSIEEGIQVLPNTLTTAQNPFGGNGRANDMRILAQNAALNWTHLASPTVVLEMRLGYSRFNFDGRPLGREATDLADRFLSLIPDSKRNPLALVPPGLGISSHSGVVSAGGLPNFSVQNSFQYVFNATMNRDKHAIKTGISVVRRQRNNFINSNPAAGTFSFPTGYTNRTGVAGGGVGFASFLLGMSNSINRGVVLGSVGRRNTEWSGYVQDDYKVTENLTLSMGLRYELFTPIREVADRIAILDLESATVVVAGENGPFGRGLREADTNNFAPRMAIAYNLPQFEDVVIRAGYGVSYIEEFGSNRFNNALNIPFAFSQAIRYSTTSPPPTLLSDGFPVPPPLSADNPFGSFRMIDPHAVAAYAQNWNFNIQWQPGDTWLIDLGYVGSKGTNLMQKTDPNQAFPGPGPIAPRRPLFALAPDVITEVGRSLGNSVYHSYQMKVEKRFSRGFHFLTSYTWSKNIDDGNGNFAHGFPNNPQNERDFRAERGLASTDVPHRLVVSYSWELPFGSGKPYLSTSPLRSVLGGWRIAGITTFSNGNVFDLRNSPNTLNVGGGTQRPDRLGDGALDNPTVARWFDIDAFATPAAFTFGNGGRNILRGPDYKQWDISLIKDTRFKERYNVQFRADFFNTFNTPQFMPPGSTIGTPTAGRISATRDASNRQIQFVLKFFF